MLDRNSFIIGVDSNYVPHIGPRVQPGIDRRNITSINLSLTQVIIQILSHQQFLTYMLVQALYQVLIQVFFQVLFLLFVQLMFQHLKQVLIQAVVQVSC